MVSATDRGVRLAAGNMLLFTLQNGLSLRFYVSVGFGQMEGLTLGSVWGSSVCFYKLLLTWGFGLWVSAS